MNYVTRINLKTSCRDRKELIDYCLSNENEQYVVIGWSYIYRYENEITDYKSFYYAVKDDVDRINHAFNVFWEVQEGSIFWTRDLDGYYWVCKAKGGAEIHPDEDKDIGAAVPVKAYKVGMEVPGQIKASFNRPRGGIVENIYDEPIIEYSKYMYNKLSGENYYEYSIKTGDLLDNLPDFDLEELIITYLQIAKDYYVLSNSIANKSTTIKIECELLSRSKENPRKAVVQVKGGNSKEIDALDYKTYIDDGYIVYLYAHSILNLDKLDNCIGIKRDEIKAFYKEYISILPESITKWEFLFK